MTHLEEDPNTMNSYDRFWRHAMQDAYRPLDVKLLILQAAWEQQGPLDRFWARVPVLQEDGTARMETLTIDRVESYANVYRARYFSIEASMEPLDAASQQEEGS